jgi:hypothetical protein
MLVIGITLLLCVSESLYVKQISYHILHFQLNSLKVQIDIGNVRRCNAYQA